MVSYCCRHVIVHQRWKIAPWQWQWHRWRDVSKGAWPSWEVCSWRTSCVRADFRPCPSPPHHSLGTSARVFISTAGWKNHQKGPVARSLHLLNMAWCSAPWSKLFSPKIIRTTRPNSQYPFEQLKQNRKLHVEMQNTTVLGFWPVKPAKNNPTPRFLSVVQVTAPLDRPKLSSSWNLWAAEAVGQHRIEVSKMKTKTKGVDGSNFKAKASGFKQHFVFWQLIEDLYSRCFRWNPLESQTADAMLLYMRLYYSILLEAAPIFSTRFSKLVTPAPIE